MAISKFLPSGSSNAPLGNQFESGVNAYGGVVVAKFSGLSSDITTAAQNLATAYGGDISIENCIFNTDVTGLAGGTNLQLLNDNAIGLNIFFSHAVSGLSGNITKDFFTATVAQRVVIANGKHFQINCTGSVCTGAGVWTLEIQYRPLLGSATLG